LPGQAAIIGMLTRLETGQQLLGILKTAGASLHLTHHAWSAAYGLLDSLVNLVAVAQMIFARTEPGINAHPGIDHERVPNIQLEPSDLDF
jgi:hypothetical protein